MKNKIIKIIGIILLIVLIIFVVYTGRNIYIISKLSNKAEETSKCTNYKQIVYNYNLDNYSKEEIFVMEDKMKIIRTELSGDDVVTITTYAKKIDDNNDKYLVNMYYDTKEDKKAILNKEIGYTKNLQNKLEIENWWQLFTTSITTSIKNETLNGKECYYITNFDGLNSTPEERMYVDKNTGILNCIISENKELTTEERENSSIIEYRYEFNNVTEDDFNEPNIKDYNIEE